MPRPTFSLNSPFSKCGMPHTNSTTSKPRVTSPRASESTLPCSEVMSANSSNVARRDCETRTYAGAGEGRGRSPFGKRIGGGLHRSIHFGGAGHTYFARERGGRIENVAEVVVAMGMNLRAGDEMRDSVHVFVVARRRGPASSPGSAIAIARMANFGLGIDDLNRLNDHTHGADGNMGNSQDSSNENTDPQKPEKPMSTNYSAARPKQPRPQEYYEDIKARFAEARDLRLKYRPEGTAAVHLRTSTGALAKRTRSTRTPKRPTARDRSTIRSRCCSSAAASRRC